MSRNIGVLALQGGYARHLTMLRQLGVNSMAIKKPGKLKECDGLIIPGGETTTLTKLMNKYEFYEPLRIFARQFPVMGTCAGAILMAKEVDDPRIEPLGLMNISVSRNAYGRQVDSFITEVETSIFGDPPFFRSVFIRAPKIVAIRQDGETLLCHREEPVMVRELNLLAITFHPELTSDPRIHACFLRMAKH